MKIKRAFTASILFVVMLGLFYYCHIAFFRVNVVFYAAILDAFLAALTAGLLLFLLNYFRILGSFEKAQLVMIWMLAGYGFAITIPTVIDRSLSFYILEKLQQRGGGIKLDAFEKVFTEEYVKEHHLVEVRLTEQQESGTITISHGCVKLTDKGDKLAHFSRFFRLNFLPKKRLLMGRYSDDMVDPFRNSSTSPNYLCK